jgi:hypothetical protein
MGEKREHGKEARQRKAQERQEAISSLKPQEQLAILDQRLGPGQGAVKERARLQAKIDAANVIIQAEPEKTS